MNKYLGAYIRVVFIFLHLGSSFTTVYAGKNDKVLTQDEYLQKIYEASITSDELTAFAHLLLQERIDYWLKKLNEVKKNNDKEAVFSKIPLYIQLKPDVKPTDMLFKCCLVDISGDAGYIDFNDKGLLELSLNKKKCKKIIYLRYVLLHELTHVEQHANRYVIDTILHIKLPVDTDFLCNQDAFNIYKSFFENKSVVVKNSNIIDRETESEADTKAIDFTSNPFALYEDIVSNKENWFFSRILTNEGYLSLHNTKKLLKNKIDSCYSKNKEKLDRHKKEYEKWNMLYQATKKKKTNKGLSIRVNENSITEIIKENNK